MITVLAACILLGQPTMKEPQSIYDFTVKDINGHSVPLSKFKGKALMFVNVASKCGNTPQYKGLEALYREKKKAGLVILGFPANNFGEQEPGTAEEIKQFCTLNYGVTFPMFSKISVKGQDEAPLYRWLVAHSDRPNDDVEWNFAKFVVSRDGKVVKRLAPKALPESEEVRQAVSLALTTP